jgi:hypothetical protein
VHKIPLEPVDIGASLQSNNKGKSMQLIAKMLNSYSYSPVYNYSISYIAAFDGQTDPVGYSSYG